MTMNPENIENQSTKLEEDSDYETSSIDTKEYGDYSTISAIELPKLFDKSETYLNYLPLTSSTPIPSSEPVETEPDISINFPESENNPDLTSWIKYNTLPKRDRKHDTIGNGTLSKVKTLSRSSFFAEECNNYFPSQTKIKKLSCKEKFVKFLYLFYEFLLEFLLVFIDTLMDFGIGIMYLIEGNYVFGTFTLILPFLSGITGSYQANIMLKTYKAFTFPTGNPGTCLKMFAKIPTVQFHILLFQKFQLKKYYYPEKIEQFPHVKEILKIVGKLSSTRGVMESTPQAILQFYIYLVYMNSVSCEIAILLPIKICLSIVITSRLIVNHWTSKELPYIFLKDPRLETEQNKHTISLFHSFLKLPYLLEAITLSSLRTLTIVFGIVLLHSSITTNLNFYTNHLNILVAVLSVSIVLLIPRILFLIFYWLKCRKSKALKEEWK